MFSLKKSEFRKNVLKNVLGTSLSQILLLIAMPILTRIYTPSEFAGLTIFMAIVAIITVISNGKFEIALVLPKQKNQEDFSDAVQIQNCLKQ